MQTDPISVSERLIDLYNWSEGRTWLLVSITTFQTYHVQFLINKKLQKFDGIIDSNENINHTINEIFKRVLTEFKFDTDKTTPTLILDLPWLQQIPQITETGFEKKKNAAQQISFNLDSSVISISAKIPESTLAVFTDCLTQHKIHCHTIISLQSLGWYMLLKELKSNTNPIFYTANGLLVCNQDNSFSEPAFEWIAFTAKPDDYLLTAISESVEQFRLLDHLSNSNERKLSSLLNLDKLTNSARLFEFQSKIAVSEVSEKQNSVHQLKMVMLFLGSVFVFITLLTFLTEYYFSGKLEQKIEWRVTNSKLISKMERTEKRNQQQGISGKDEQQSGLTIDRFAELNSELGNEIIFYKWNLGIAEGSSNKLMGFTNSQTEISKYVSHLNQSKNIKSAKLILLSPIDRNNKADASFSGKFNLKFVIEVQFNV